MGTKNLSAIRAIVRQVLRDEFDVDDAANMEWQDDEIDIHIGECLLKISRKRPRIVKEALPAIANSRVLDISSIEDLLYINKAEYPINNYPRDFRNIIELDDEQVEISITRIPTTGGSGTLTGTVTFTLASAAVTGVGTAFTTELKVGYHIKKSSGTRWYRISSITSDTALTLAEPSHDTGADTAAKTKYCYEPVYLYCAKLHTLTEDTSTLTPQLEELLVVGVSGKAAIAKARSMIGEVNVGGGRTPADMQAWGVTQLALFNTGLLEIRTTRTSRVYPKD